METSGCCYLFLKDHQKKFKVQTSSEEKKQSQRSYFGYRGYQSNPWYHCCYCYYSRPSQELLPPSFAACLLCSHRGEWWSFSSSFWPESCMPKSFAFVSRRWSEDCPSLDQLEHILINSVCFYLSREPRQHPAFHLRQLHAQSIALFSKACGTKIRGLRSHLLHQVTPW